MFSTHLYPLILISSYPIRNYPGRCVWSYWCHYSHRGDCLCFQEVCHYSTFFLFVLGHIICYFTFSVFTLEFLSFNFFYFLGLAWRNVRRKMGSQQSSRWKCRPLRWGKQKHSQPLLKCPQSKLERNLRTYNFKPQMYIETFVFVFLVKWFFFFLRSKGLTKKKGQITFLLLIYLYFILVSSVWKFLIYIVLYVRQTGHITIKILSRNVCMVLNGLKCKTVALSACENISVWW